MIVWTKKAEDDFKHKYPGRKVTRKAGEKALWDGIEVTKDRGLMHSFFLRGWIEENDSGKNPHCNNGNDISLLVDYDSFQSQRIETLKQNCIKRAEHRWLRILHFVKRGFTAKQVAAELHITRTSLSKWVYKWRGYFADTYGDIKYYNGRAK